MNYVVDVCSGLCLLRVPGDRHSGSLSLVSSERRAVFSMWNNDETLRYLSVEESASLTLVLVASIRGW